MIFSSYQFSELNLARKDFSQARSYIAQANRGIFSKPWAFRNFNQARNRLLDICIKLRTRL